MIETAFQDRGVRVIPFERIAEYVSQNGTGETSLTIRPAVSHDEVLAEILTQLQPIDFRDKGNLDAEQKITQKHQIVISVQEIVETALALHCGLCRQLEYVYTFNGQFWRQIDKEELCQFLERQRRGSASRLSRRVISSSARRS